MYYYTITICKISQSCNIFFIVSSLVRKLKQQTREQMEERRPNLVAALHQMGDFYMELKWDFQSWGKLFMHYFMFLIA